MNAEKKKIEDAGEFIPFAKKHSASKHDKNTNDVSLKTLWPAPDWYKLIELGYEVEAVLFYKLVYEGLRKKPRPSDSFATDDEWAKQFATSINVIKDLMAKNKTVLSLDDYIDRFDRVMNPSGKEELKYCYPSYAIGRGRGRTYYHPFSLTTRNRNLLDLAIDLGWPNNKEALKTQYFPVELTDDSWVLAQISGKKYTWRVDDSFETREQALEVAKERLESAGKPKTYNPKKAKVTVDIATSRGVKDITAEQMIDHFKFRGIQFGNSMSNAERQRWLNNVYVALEDLRKAIGFEPHWIGLGGIALAFGARGQGGAQAHYEPSLKVINLTRASGAGSIAHEWFHAFDHRISTSLQVHHSFFSENIHHLVRSSLDSEETLRKYPKCRDGHMSFVQIEEAITGGGESLYLKAAKKLARQTGKMHYWAEPEELYARAFEAWVQDKLKKMNVDSPWLVTCTLESDYEPLDGMHPYPGGEERIRINRTFEKMMCLMAKH